MHICSPWVYPVSQSSYCIVGILLICNLLSHTLWKISIVIYRPGFHVVFLLSLSVNTMNRILSSNVYILVPIGPIGCGKSTLGRCLATLYSWPHIQNLASGSPSSQSSRWPATPLLVHAGPASQASLYKDMPKSDSPSSISSSSSSSSINSVSSMPWGSSANQTHATNYSLEDPARSSSLGWCSTPIRANPQSYHYSCMLAKSIGDAALNAARYAANPDIANTGALLSRGAENSIVVYADGNYHIDRERKILITTLTEHLEPYVNSLRFVALYFDYSEMMALPSPSASLAFAKPQPKSKFSHNRSRPRTRVFRNDDPVSPAVRAALCDFQNNQPISDIRPQFDDIIPLSVSRLNSSREILGQLILALEDILPYVPTNPELDSVFYMAIQSQSV